MLDSQRKDGSEASDDQREPELDSVRKRFFQRLRMNQTAPMTIKTPRTVSKR